MKVNCNARHPAVLTTGCIRPVDHSGYHSNGEVEWPNQAAAPVVPAERPQYQDTKDEGARVAPSVPCVERAGSTAEPCTGAVTADKRTERIQEATLRDLTSRIFYAMSSVDALAKSARLFQEDSEILRHSNIIEIAVRNQTGSVSDYMNHWEGRALKAEALAASAADRVSALTALVQRHTIDDLPMKGSRFDLFLTELAALLDPAERPVEEK